MEEFLRKKNTPFDTALNCSAFNIQDVTRLEKNTNIILLSMLFSSVMEPCFAKCGYLHAFEHYQSYINNKIDCSVTLEKFLQTFVFF